MAGAACEQYEVQQPARRKVHRPDPRRVLRNRILKAFLLIMAAYFIVVLRSNAMVQYGNELVSLQQQETQLITKNNELKIEVEQLKVLTVLSVWPNSIWV